MSGLETAEYRYRHLGPKRGGEPPKHAGARIETSGFQLWMCLLAFKRLPVLDVELSSAELLTD